MDKKKISKDYLHKINLLEEFNKNYYDKDNPIVSDQEYDLLKKEIIDLEIDPYGLETIANVDFTDSELSAWVADGNINLSHDVNGYLVAHVTAFTGEFYQENISIGNLNTATDHTYTITFI